MKFEFKVFIHTNDNEEYLCVITSNNSSHGTLSITDGISNFYSLAIDKHNQEAIEQLKGSKNELSFNSESGLVFYTGKDATSKLLQLEKQEDAVLGIKELLFVFAKGQLDNLEHQKLTKELSDSKEKIKQLNETINSLKRAHDANAMSFGKNVGSNSLIQPPVKQKGASLLNPRIKKAVVKKAASKGADFSDDDD